MEYGLEVKCTSRMEPVQNCLNPCFNGIWSRSVFICVRQLHRDGVLILVLMEYGLEDNI